MPVNAVLENAIVLLLAFVAICAIVLAGYYVVLGVVVLVKLALRGVESKRPRSKP
jgi:hypothetical protein